MLREISGPAGSLEALLNGPVDRPDGEPVRAAVVFGHPHPQHGGTMHTKGAYQSAKALSRIGCAVLRFNFRGVGRSAGAFAEGAGESDDFRAALDVMASRYPGAPLWAAGMSFGAWVGLTVGAADPRVSVLLGVAVPVNKYDFSAVGSSSTPKFFVHGEFDEICSEKQIREFYAGADDPKELVIIEAANHLFEGRVSLVGEAIEDLLGDWPP
jgi:alpha/beta superfamily hydrolase